jgi:transcriptional regulator with XRE-family HTH domain
MKYKVDTTALRKLMIDNGFDTIISLEKASGVNRNTISGILKETIRPSVQVMDALAAALHMSPAIAGSVFFAPDLRIA